MWLQIRLIRPSVLLDLDAISSICLAHCINMPCPLQCGLGQVSDKKRSEWECLCHENSNQIPWRTRGIKKVHLFQQRLMTPKNWCRNMLKMEESDLDLQKTDHWNFRTRGYLPWCLPITEWSIHQLKWSFMAVESFGKGSSHCFIGINGMAGHLPIALRHSNNSGHYLEPKICCDRGRVGNLFPALPVQSYTEVVVEPKIH